MITNDEYRELVRLNDRWYTLSLSEKLRLGRLKMWQRDAIPPDLRNKFYKTLKDYDSLHN